MMAWKLRPAATEDQEFLYQVKKTSNFSYISLLWGWDEDFQRKEFSQDFQKIQEFSVITVDGTDAGFLQLQQRADFLNVAELHLLPPFQGQGIGSEILRHILRHTDQPVLIGCFRGNTGAYQLYQHLGFTPITETDSHFILIHHPTIQEE